VAAIRREHGAGARILRVRTGLRLGQAVSRQLFSCREYRQIFFLLLLRAEENDGESADSGVATVAHSKRSVRRQFLGELHGRNLVQARAAVFIRHTAAEQSDFARLLQKLRHQAGLVLLEIGNRRHYFVSDKLLRRLADEFLIVGEIGGRKDILGRAGLNQETAAARRGPWQRRCGHESSSARSERRQPRRPLVEVAAEKLDCSSF